MTERESRKSHSSRSLERLRKVKKFQFGRNGCVQAKSPGLVRPDRWPHEQELMCESPGDGMRAEHREEVDQRQNKGYLLPPIRLCSRSWTANGRHGPEVGELNQKRIHSETFHGGSWSWPRM